MAESKRDGGACCNDRTVIEILIADITFLQRNFLSEPVELPLLSIRNFLTRMFVEKPATRIKILLIAFRQSYFLAAREALRVGDHFGGWRL
jgi:hypothetical protein